MPASKSRRKIVVAPYLGIFYHELRAGQYVDLWSVFQIHRESFEAPLHRDRFYLD